MKNGVQIKVTVDDIGKLEDTIKKINEIKKKHLFGTDVDVIIEVLQS